MTDSAHAIPELDRKGLRNFGLTIGSTVVLLFGLFVPWLFEKPLPIWPWIFFAIFVLWAAVAPGTLRLTYTLWMRFGLLIGKITTPIIMGAVFYLVVSPIGLIMRVGGNDPLNWKIDRDSKSYRVESSVTSKESLDKPF